MNEINYCQYHELRRGTLCICSDDSNDLPLALDLMIAKDVILTVNLEINELTLYANAGIGVLPVLVTDIFVKIK